MGIWSGIIMCVIVWGLLVYNLITVAIGEKNGKKAPKYSERVLKEMEALGIEPWADEE